MVNEILFTAHIFCTYSMFKQHGIFAGMNANSPIFEQKCYFFLPGFHGIGKQRFLPGKWRSLLRCYHRIFRNKKCHKIVP
jgi:hypothetical protein